MKINVFGHRDACYGPSPDITSDNQPDYKATCIFNTARSEAD